MKKLNILMIMLITSFVFMACEKENIDNNASTNNGENKQASIQSEMEMSELEIDINNFLEKMEGEEEGSLPLDEAVYYLEAGFNYRYAHAGNDNDLVSTMVDTSFVGINILEDEFCEFADLSTTFGNIYNKMDNFFEVIENEAKALHIVDVELVEIESQSKLRLISSWKYGVKPFDFFDGDWWWGNGRGRCDHTDQPYDAKDAIMFKYDINHVRPYGIWTNIDSYMAIHYEYFPLPTGQNNPFGFGDYYIYANGDDCLKENEIDYYARVLDNAIDIAKTNHPFDPPTTKATQDAILLEGLITGKGEFYRLQVKVGDFQSQRVGLGNQDFYQLY